VLTVIGLLLNWIRRERPAHVVIQEISSVGLLDVHPPHRDRLQAFYVYEDGTSVAVEDRDRRR
jgi:hypothetical protein